MQRWHENGADDDIVENEVPAYLVLTALESNFFEYAGDSSADPGICSVDERSSSTRAVSTPTLDGCLADHDEGCRAEVSHQQEEPQTLQNS